MLVTALDQGLVRARRTRLSAAARDRIRRALTAALRQIPDRLFAPLRTSFPSTDPTSTRHRLLESVLKAARYRGVPPEIETFLLPDNASIRIANADSFIVEWLYWFGERYGYEHSTIKWWKHFCASSSSILELGSNIGYYIVQGAPMNAQSHYVAVEPHPGCAALCRRNIELNAIVNAEVMEAAAVADLAKEAVELILPGGRDHYRGAPCSGFVGINEVHGSTEDRTMFSSVMVPAVSVSTLVDSSTDLIKMDVEGQEHVLLAAMLEFLKSSRPTVFVELLDDTSHLRALIVNELLPAGYRCLVPSLKGLIPLSEDRILNVSLVKDYGTRDVILTAKRPPTPAEDP